MTDLQGSRVPRGSQPHEGDDGLVPADHQAPRLEDELPYVCFVDELLTSMLDDRKRKMVLRMLAGTRTVRRDALRLGQPRAQRAREHLEAVGGPGLALVPLDLDLPPGRVPGRAGCGDS